MKSYSAAAERNREPILTVLRRVLPDRGRVLEIASGTGQHAVHFAAGLPHLEWQPTDVEPIALASVAAWVEECGLANALAPLTLDVQDGGGWPPADAVYCANMVHIAPWACAQGLFAGAGRVLAPGAPLITYGPYRFSGEGWGRETVESNLRFDALLRARDPRWGVRELDDLVAAAGEAALELEEVVDLPANNHVLVFRRR